MVPNFNKISEEKDFRYLEFANIEYSLQNLQTFSFIKHQIEKQEVQLHGVYFDILNGSLWIRNSENGQFLSNE
ncbi:MAG: hypothetical protein IR526_03850 [Bordetella sp.]|nr:MAG: hypothetical protein IR526_03850 [Bordetella sp.]